MRLQWMCPLLIVLLCPTLPRAATVHVPGDQPTIQAGIDAAIPGDTVLVADGVYTGDGNRDLDFQGKWLILQSAGGPDNCIIDCQSVEEDYHRAFIFHSYETEMTMVLGFTMRNAYTPDDEYNGEGGAIICDDASPTIEDCHFIGCTAGDGAGIACVNDAAPRINRCRFNNNFAFNSGAGIYAYNARLLVTDCTFTENEGRWGGGIVGRSSELQVSGCHFGSNTGIGLGAESCDAVITGCTFFDNSSTGNCGGLAVGSDSYDYVSVVEDCIISGNYAELNGGGLCLSDKVTARNCLIIGNHADREGGGISAYYDTTATIINCTVAGNSADQGGGAYAANYGSGVESVTMVNCVIRGNTGEPVFDFYGEAPVITYSNVQGGYTGTGNIDADPLFVTGPLGEHYLSQIAAGQAANSPCVNTGDPASDPVGGTTRTDSGPDSGIVDMGYHSPVWIPAPRIVTGPGPGYDNPPTVRVFPAEADPFWLTSFQAYGAVRYGVNVAAGDFDGDGADELLTGGGPGAVYGPHVRGFQVSGPAIADLSFLAYGTNKFGVNVAAGDLDGDGFDEIVTGAGPGAIYGPHVRGWNVDGDAAVAMPSVSFLAYGTNRMGVNVTCGDVDGDGIDEILTGPGPSSFFGAHVRGWQLDGGGVAAMAGISFFAWSPDQLRYGANVSCRADLDGDGRSEIVVGPGPDPDAASPVQVYHYTSGTVTGWFDFDAYSSSLDKGTNVTAGLF